jgi:hypothetical protein
MDSRYPVGRFTFEPPATPAQRAAWCDEIAAAPGRLEAAHAAHEEALRLTEDGARITPYDEARWAELADAKSAPVDVSVRLLEALHERWVALIRSTAPADFARSLVHPEHADGLTLDKLVALYAWHGRHHVGQIEHLRERLGWR